MLQINAIINSGSKGRVAEGIDELAISEGWESYIAYGRENRYSKSILIRIGFNIDIYFHVLKPRLFDSHGLGSKIATKNSFLKMERRLIQK